MKKMLILLFVPMLAFCSSKREQREREVWNEYTQQAEIHAAVWREKLNIQQKRFDAYHKHNEKMSNLYDSLMINCDFRLDTLQTSLEHLDKQLQELKK